MGNSEFSWAKERDWKPGSFDKIAEDGHCNLTAYFGDRIVQCRLNLTITSSKLTDSGTYRLRTRKYVRIMKNVYQEFKVIIFKSVPVISPVKMEAYSLTIRCDDVFNRNAEIQFHYRDMDHQPTVPHHFVTGNFHGDEYALIQQAGIHDRGVDFTVKCCALNHGQTTCTNWTYIWVDIKLHGGRAQSHLRPWCKGRNEDHIKNIDMDSTHFGPLISPVCLENDFITFNNSLITVCEKHHSNISLFYKQTVGWNKKRMFGGSRRVKYGPKLMLKGSLNESGEYFTSSQERFEVKVHPVLTVTIRLLQMLDHSIYLECLHTGRTDSEIKWIVSGQYSSYEVDKKGRLIFKPDCWYNYRDWYAEFGIHCTVTSGPWKGVSRWFLGKYWRSKYNRGGEKLPELKIDLN
nr:MAG: putative 10.5 kDa protein [unidentified adenovirus]